MSCNGPRGCVDHHERRPAVRTTVLHRYGVPVRLRRARTPSPEDQIEMGALVGNPSESPVNEVGGMSTAAAVREPPHGTTVLTATLAALEVAAARRFECDGRVRAWIGWRILVEDVCKVSLELVLRNEVWYHEARRAELAIRAHRIDPPRVSIAPDREGSTEDIE